MCDWVVSQLLTVLQLRCAAQLEAEVLCGMCRVKDDGFVGCVCSWPECLLDSLSKIGLHILESHFSKI